MTETLLLVRHCSTALNEEASLLSARNPGLSSRGLEQAPHVRRWLRSYEVDRMIASPSARSVETAERITDRRVAVDVDDRLIERHLGDWEGLSSDELVRRRRERSLGVVDLTQDWCGAADVESDEAVHARVCHVLAEHDEADTLAIVTHAGVIKSFLYVDLRVAAERPLAFRVTLGGAARLQRRKGRWEVHELWANPAASPPAIH